MGEYSNWGSWSNMTMSLTALRQPPPYPKGEHGATLGTQRCDFSSIYHLYYFLLEMNLQHSPKSSTLLVMGEYSNWGSWSNMTMSLTLESMHSRDPNWGLSINFWHFTYPLDSTTFASAIRHNGLKSFLKDHLMIKQWRNSFHNLLRLITTFMLCTQSLLVSNWPNFK